MPRQARLDAPGVLQHVMARGIERRKIFWDDKDRTSFLERLAIILEETQTQCYAWTLIPNHFHLLLRTGPTPLSKVMRRLMTGYAVTFNLRHRRAGHLFQNRYKSVVCEEENYLLELTRYIHLNPLRAKLVEDLKSLDKYPWTGHSVLIGKQKNPLIPKLEKEVSSADKRISFSQFHLETEKARMNPENPVNPVRTISLAEKTVEDVLLYFGETFKVGRRRYRQFVKKGIKQGRREDLQGGGLIRSSGGDKAGVLGQKKKERENGDARILGSGNFVTKVLEKANEVNQKRMDKCSLQVLCQKIISAFSIKEEELRSSIKKRGVTEAKASFSYFAIKAMGYSGREVGQFLNIRSYSAIRISEKGKEILDKRGISWNSLVK